MLIPVAGQRRQKHNLTLYGFSDLLLQLHAGLVFIQLPVCLLALLTRKCNGVFQEPQLNNACELESLQKIASNYDWRQKSVKNVYESLIGCQIFDVCI